MLHTSLPLTTIPYGVGLGVVTGVVAGDVEVTNGVGHSIKNRHLVLVSGANTISFAWSGRGLFFTKNPEPIPVPVTGGNPLSAKS